MTCLAILCAQTSNLFIYYLLILFFIQILEPFVFCFCCFNCLTVELGVRIGTLSYASPASDSAAAAAAAAQLTWTGAHRAELPHVPRRAALRHRGTDALRARAVRCGQSKKGETHSCGSYTISRCTRRQSAAGRSSNLLLFIFFPT